MNELIKKFKYKIEKGDEDDIVFLTANSNNMAYLKNEYKSSLILLQNFVYNNPQKEICFGKIRNL